MDCLHALLHPQPLANLESSRLRKSCATQAYQAAFQRVGSLHVVVCEHGSGPPSLLRGRELHLAQARMLSVPDINDQLDPGTSVIGNY